MRDSPPTVRATLWHGQGEREPETQPGPGPGSASHPHKLSCIDRPPTPSRQGTQEPRGFDGRWFWKPPCAGRSTLCHWAVIALRVSPCAGETAWRTNCSEAVWWGKPGMTSAPK